MRPAAVFALFCFVFAPNALQAMDLTTSRRLAATWYLQFRLPANTTASRFTERARETFVATDANIDGALTIADTDIIASMRTAQFRSSTLAQLTRADLDQDGAVTAEELRTLLRFERQIGRLAVQTIDRVEASVAKMMSWDADGDGLVSFAEAQIATQTIPTMDAPGTNSATDVLETLMAFDADGDGAVTWSELKTAFETFFRTLDTDQDGIISSKEYAAYHARAYDSTPGAEESIRRFEAKVHAKCAMPKASSSAKVVVLGTHQTNALSNVALGSMDDVTRAGTIIVEPGSEPLYLVITNFVATIWQFTGAVDRIERVVLASKYASGATGLPAERVTSLPAKVCLPHSSNVDVDAADTAIAVERDIGRAPDLVFGRSELTSFGLPSGAVQLRGNQKPNTILTPRYGPASSTTGDTSNVDAQMHAIASLEQQLLRFSPGGVIEIDPAKVISSAAVASYDVLPEEAGLLQLMRSGALTQEPDGTFLIHRKIRFPAGLAGAHSVKFLILRDTPQPIGDPIHCRIAREREDKPIGPN
ncbi:EF-hand domain-containing protein [Rhodopseudomonas palustris]|uniref:EF-hand domain-containing protein n=1 Tax=Rhodopseudomonas palustris TaxID=1076 RepID=UPI002ACD7D87|nr:EF-hand domain-containing protein [Rhodopseudomonas palustris]WQH01134.1 EF-hand domain-containing protein [Rhodopseudomonas palustris]